MKSVAIMQSHYVPWLGFFDLVGGCTDVVILDSVGFSKNSYFNRNQLRSRDQRFWITIPVLTRGRFGQQISSVIVENNTWPTKHFSSVCSSVGHAPHFASYKSEWSDYFKRCTELVSLSEINLMWLNYMIQELQLDVYIHLDTAFDISSKEKTGRLVEICKKLEASIYRTGPRGLDYINLVEFTSAEIEVQVINYSSYYPYLGTYGTDIPPVSALENLAYMGSSARELLLHDFRSIN